jgi:predicted amidohydrolase
MSPDARQLGIIALAQTPASVEVPRNLHHITTMMRRAKAAGADLVQFTEGALSGYGRKLLTPFRHGAAKIGSG